jgi:hypothetical protein
MKAQALIVGCLAALVALSVAWFRANFEKAPVKEWVGPTGEARTRQFLAAERLAERMGWSATELRSLPSISALPADGVLVLPNGRQALSVGRLSDVVEWVERGGSVLVEAESLGVPDPLLELVGVERSQGVVAKTLGADLGAGRRISVAMPGDMRLVPLAGRAVHFRVGAIDNLKLVSFRWREGGVVSVATSLNFARNRAIGLNDHAELFWHLVSDADAPELVVYWSPTRLSLSDFLRENAAPALIALGLALALWLWSIGPRFGPVAPDAPPGRRRLLDHLRASGRYFWTSGLRSRLVVAARDAALRRIARAQPDFVSASQAERIARLSSLAQISREDAARFLSAAGAMRGADFVKITHHAQRVHSALEKGAKQK